jgi:predicted RNA binding protein YcfA (HicA-like mRNA interferase family)
MTKPDKLYQQLLASSSRSVSFRDYERLVLAFGFRLQRVRGSHRHYTHPNVPTVLSINPNKGDAHRYQVRLLLELVEECALSIEA